MLVTARLAKTASATLVEHRTSRWLPAFLERPDVLGPLLVAPAILYILASHHRVRGHFRTELSKTWPGAPLYFKP